MELEWVIDGTTVVGTQAAADTDCWVYWVYWAPRYALSGVLVVSAALVGVASHQYGFLEARSLRIRLRKTTNAGNGNLQAHVVYALRDLRLMQ